ncbi:alpha/beta hydrolase [Nitrospirillum sp. BR 11828]|uniref:alpha/beta hydrolase n=1 Tax=Nitrospirillum sp. BR 11828 TaxID=3104325 RepID=UPI002ACA64FE|nr:alpha/beta hydrolase [Nitrospirillum sp. BR 11828]MDZ5649464.1 alpha/beta hydrolase [Nitrospirillum sp. BR 11828]
MTTTPTIKRRFIDTSFGQVHCRTVGEDGPVLVMHHASPGSAKQLETLMRLLAARYRVFAFDTPGNGDSSPLPLEAPTITDLAVGLIEAMRALCLRDIVVYGSHTGADVALEVAIAAPDLVRKVVVDGVAVFTPEQRDDYLVNYALPFAPDLDGAYLMRCFMFCRDQYLFFPWFKRDRAHRRDNGLGTPEALRDWVVEVLKAGETYFRAYRAAFVYEPLRRIGLVSQPILALSSVEDPLLETTRQAAAEVDAPFRTLPGFRDPEFGPALRDEVFAFVG